MTTQPEYMSPGGGNTTIVNGDEKALLDECNTLPAVAVGYREDDSHRVGVFARADDVAGS